MTQEAQKDTVIDDIGIDSEPTFIQEEDSSGEVHQAKLLSLKEKLAKKDLMPPKIVEKKTRSIKFGIIGSGQAGSRIAESFYQLGYQAVVFNTASQDLEDIKIPEVDKYLISHGLGGSAKTLSIGQEAAEAHKDSINEFIKTRLDDSQVLLLALSLGGGSGAGSAETMIDILSSMERPIVVITVLPMSNEDAQTKKNSLETLSKLLKEVQNKRIHNLIVVDNAKIETIYSDVSQMDFYQVSNKAIVSPIDVFNSFSSRPSSVKGLDPAEFGKILTDGGGLTVYGELSVANYEEDTAIAEAVINNLNSGLLASGFELKQSKYVGVLIIANKSVWEKIPSVSVNYAMAMVGEQCGTPDGIFRGIYVSEDVKDDVVKVYSFFSGLGLPDLRIQQLKTEVQELSVKTKDKDQARNLSLKLDTGKDEVISAADKVRQKISQKKSAFGSLMTNSISDLRKK